MHRKLKSLSNCNYASKLIHRVYSIYNLSEQINEDFDFVNISKIIVHVLAKKIFILQFSSVIHRIVACPLSNASLIFFFVCL